MTTRRGCIPETATALASQLLQLANEWGDETAIVELCRDGSERSLTRRELFTAVEKVASHLHDRGIAEGHYVAIALPNCLEHVVVTIAAWQLGACCTFIPPKETESERRDLLGILDYRLLVADWSLDEDRDHIDQATLRSWMEGDFPRGAEELPFFAVAPARAVATGGSSGKPKIVVQRIKPAYSHADLESWSYITGQGAWDRQLVPGALFHNLYSNATFMGLFFGQTIFLMDKFDAARALELVEEKGIQCMALVPTMMERMMLDPSFETRDLDSLKTIFHSGGPCPDRAKLAWINRIGAKKVFELYAATEMIGSAVIRGDEWLEHRGSVGRGVGCVFRIQDEHGNVLGPGEIGEIYSKPVSNLITFYLGGAKIDATDDGFYSVNDLGWLDEDGYLYLSDRRSDMIVTGGKNVYTVEVENAVCDYPCVRDVVVIGMPDSEWGLRVHAILELSCSEEEFSFADLQAFLHEKLSGYKCPKTYEIVQEMPRNEVGKVRRRALIEERVSRAEGHRDMPTESKPAGSQEQAR